MSLRAELIAIAEQHVIGSDEPARHTHIECNCPGLVHRKDEYEQGCYCPECASNEAVRRGFDADDTEAEHEGPDDNPQWCENCGRLITLRSTPECDWGITPNGALEELEHFESGLGAKRGEPKTPNDWQEILLMLDTLDESLLPRAEVVIMRSIGSGS